MIIKHNGSERELILIKKIFVFLAFLCGISGAMADDPSIIATGGGLEDISICSESDDHWRYPKNGTEYSCPLPVESNCTKKLNCARTQVADCKEECSTTLTGGKIQSEKYTQQNGSNSYFWQEYSKIITANTGYYYNNGGFSVCGKGHCCTYSNSQGARYECKRGTFSAGENLKCIGGEGYCTSPQDGFFADENNTKETKCPVGTCCLNGINYDCNDGTYSDAEGLKCADDTAGKCKSFSQLIGYDCSGLAQAECVSKSLCEFSDNVCRLKPVVCEKGKCEVCPSGYYCNGGTKKECTNGYSTGGQSECTPFSAAGDLNESGKAKYCTSYGCFICPNNYCCLDGNRYLCDDGSFTITQGLRCKFKPENNDKKGRCLRFSKSANDTEGWGWPVNLLRSSVYYQE